MDTCPDESNKFQNKENIMNSCDKWRLKDVRNCSGSEDMFSGMYLFKCFIDEYQKMVFLHYLTVGKIFL